MIMLFWCTSNEAYMAREMENPDTSPEKEAVIRAIDRFKVAKRALNECDLEIDVSRMTKNSDGLQKWISDRNKLVEEVQYAREGVHGAIVDFTKARYMRAARDEERANKGLLHKATAMITKIIR